MMLKLTSVLTVGLALGAVGLTGCSAETSDGVEESAADQDPATEAEGPQDPGTSEEVGQVSQGLNIIISMKCPTGTYFSLTLKKCVPR